MTVEEATEGGIAGAPERDPCIMGCTSGEPPKVGRDRELEQSERFLTGRGVRRRIATSLA